MPPALNRDVSARLECSDHFLVFGRRRSWEVCNDHRRMRPDNSKNETGASNANLVPMAFAVIDSDGISISDFIAMLADSVFQRT
jgi:hypothetical protein